MLNSAVIFWSNMYALYLSMVIIKYCVYDTINYVWNNEV